MDYVLILLAVTCYAAQFAFTKVYGGMVKQTASTSLMMLLVIGTTGAVMCFCISGFSVDFSAVSVMWAAVFALVTIPYYMIGVKVLSMGSLAIYSMFMMLGGMLVPVAYGVLFLREAASAGKLLGTVLLTAFIVMQALTQKTPEVTQKAEGKQKILFFTLCMAIFFINGSTSVIAKAHQLSVNAVNEASFTTTACCFIAILSALLLAIFSVKDPGNVKRELTQMLKWRSTGVVAGISIVQQSGNLLLLKAASSVPASVQFPLISGGVIVLSALVSAFVFREKLSKVEWIAIAGAFVSTVLYAF